jgi:hypothetical protein
MGECIWRCKNDDGVAQSLKPRMILIVLNRVRKRQENRLQGWVNFGCQLTTLTDKLGIQHLFAQGEAFFNLKGVICSGKSIKGVSLVFAILSKT